MSSKSSNPRQRRPAPPSAPPDLPMPPDAGVQTFEIGGEKYALFSFALPRIRLPSGLTAAEQSVVSAVLDGHTNADIARSRGTSVNTVANQLRTIYSKLGVSDRLGLMRRCAVESRNAPAPSPSNAGMPPRRPRSR